MTLPSKELLSAVLGHNEIVDCINIYELSHMCKEWAYDNGYELFSRILSNDHQPKGNCLVIRAESDPEDVIKIENADSEHEAIFKACEWILKETKWKQNG